MAQGAAAKLTTHFSKEDLANLREYYGIPPELLDGINYMKNAESQNFLMDVTDSANDLARLAPATSNLPLINVLVDGTYKCRALFDTGATNTVVSSTLLQHMPEV